MALSSEPGKGIFYSNGWRRKNPRGAPPILCQKGTGADWSVPMRTCWWMAGAARCSWSPSSTGCREQLCPSRGAAGGTRSQRAPAGTRTASATHVRFRKLRSESIDNKLRKPWCWYSSPPFHTGQGAAGGPTAEQNSANCSEECSLSAEVMGQNVNQRLRTSISAYNYPTGVMYPIPAPPHKSTYVGVAQMSIFMHKEAKSQTSILSST